MDFSGSGPGRGGGLLNAARPARGARTWPSIPEPPPVSKRKPPSGHIASSGLLRRLAAPRAPGSRNPLFANAGPFGGTRTRRSRGARRRGGVEAARASSRSRSHPRPRPASLSSPAFANRFSPMPWIRAGEGPGAPRVRLLRLPGGSAGLTPRRTRPRGPLRGVRLLAARSSPPPLPDRPRGGRARHRRGRRSPRRRRTPSARPAPLSRKGASPCGNPRSPVPPTAARAAIVVLHTVGDYVFTSVFVDFTVDKVLPFRACGEVPEP